MNKAVCVVGASLVSFAGYWLVLMALFFILATYFDSQTSALARFIGRHEPTWLAYTFMVWPLIYPVLGIPFFYRKCQRFWH